MRILILSCSTGEGHNSCARAMKEYIEKAGDVCAIADALRFISEPVSQTVSKGHTYIYRHCPSLFRLGYDYLEKHPAAFQDRSKIRRFMTRGRERLYHCILDGHYDGVICTHVFSALMLTDVLAEHDLSLPTCFVATDYTCSPSTKDSCLDRYFIPDLSLARDFVCRNIPLEHITGSGIPVRQMFYGKKSREEARKQFGVTGGGKHLVIMCGSMGCGPITQLALYLTQGMSQATHLTVVCGTNQALQRQLQKQYRALDNVHIRGYVRDMAGLMDSADLYLTKPGGISVTEAALKNLPMVFVDAVAGCETYNRLYYTRCGGARTAATVPELARLCLGLLEQEEELEQMRQALAALPKENAAQLIHAFFGRGEGIDENEKSDP